MYNVLICDDQPDIVNALKIYLKSEGYQLFTAYTGREAIDIDQRIVERAGRSIPEIMAAEGEAAFRKLPRRDVLLAPGRMGLRHERPQGRRLHPRKALNGRKLAQRLSLLTSMQKA